jgi:hypothetical protein
MRNLFGPKAEPDAGERERIRGWVRECFGLNPDESISIAELHCSEPDCPDVETVIGILVPGAARKYKVLKAVVDVALDDIRELARLADPLPSAGATS